MLCLIVEGRLECSLTFDPAAVMPADARRLMQGLMQALTLGDSPGSSGTPCMPFTYQMSGEDLDELLDLD